MGKRVKGDIEMGINITINKREKAQRRGEFHNSAPYDLRFGFWGMVTEVHPEDCTVHVLMDTGREISGVRVASMEWVTIDDGKGYLSGERHLPPVNTFVFCIMPSGDVSSAFVLCSGFTRDEALHGDFKRGGDDAAAVWERVGNTGWKSSADYRSGSVKIKNNAGFDADISLEINQEVKGEESVCVKVHGNTILIKKDGVKFTTDGSAGIDIAGDASVNVGGNSIVKVTGDANIEADKAVIKSSDTLLTGGKVTIGGSVKSTGSGALCGIATCPFCGALHVGEVTEDA